MDEVELNARLECLRIAVEFGTQRDFTNPDLLAERYWQWVSQGSEGTRPEDSLTEGSPKQAKNVRSVRKGSAPQKTKAV